MTDPITTLRVRIVAWATQQPTIRALLLIGSLADRGAASDAQSDLDLVAYALDPEQYAAPDWLAALSGPGVGEPLVGEVGRWPDGSTEHMVVFEAGAKVDLAFRPFATLQHEAQAGLLHPVYQRGYDVLVDKDGLAAQLPASSTEPDPVAPPTAHQYAEVVHTFWLWALRTAQSIWRGELWVAKYRDWKLKQALLTVIEWAAQSRGQDTWHGGRVMRRWTDDATWSALPHTFGGFEAESSWAALAATVALFRRVAGEVAAVYGFSYPTRIDAALTERIHDLHQHQQAATPLRDE
jgi:aminoglycoside 6-adenylyltransferase